MKQYVDGLVDGLCEDYRVIQMLREQKISVENIRRLYRKIYNDRTLISQIYEIHKSYVQIGNLYIPAIEVGVCGHVSVSENIHDIIVARIVLKKMSEDAPCKIKNISI